MERRPGLAKTIAYQTLAEQTLDQLREAIFFGEIAPGSPLRLQDLAVALGTSIAPIREAVRQLAGLGLAEHVPHHGARVIALNVEEMREIFSVRLALEGMALKRASQLFRRADEDAGQEQLAAYEAARRRGDIRTALRAHAAFHFALYGAARSTWLLRLIRPVWDSCERYRLVLLSPRGELPERHQRLDRELLEACAAHDLTRATRVFRQHLDLATECYAYELQSRSIFAWHVNM